MDGAQRQIQNPLALRLIAGEFSEGDKIKVDVAKDGEMVFEKAGEAQVQQAM